MSPPPHLSPPLKLHSFLSKTTICRSPPPWAPTTSTPLGSNQPSTTWTQSPHYPYLPTNAPPLGPNHPITHHTMPNHQPPVGPNQPTTSWPQSPHHPYAPTHTPHLAPTNPPPLGTNPSPLGPNHSSASTSSSASSSSSSCASTSCSTSASPSTRELEIIEKILHPKFAKFKFFFYHLVVVECPHHLTCHHH